MNSSSSRQLWLNLLLIGILTGFFAFVLYRLFFALNYNWNWSVIPTYLVRYDEQSGRWLPNILLQGLFTTIKLSIWGMLLAGLLGLIIGILRTSKRLFFRLSARTFVELIRNTPPLVLVFIFYFFVSDQILPAIGADAFVRGLSERPTERRLVGLGPEQIDDILLVTASQRQGIEDEERQSNHEPSDVERTDEYEVESPFDVASGLFRDFGLCLRSASHRLQSSSAP